MALESPICVSVVSRLPSPELNTAAFNILMAIALFIETPIIDLLSTSTTLSKNHHDFALLSRFVWYLVLTVAVGHAIFVLTPFYWVVTRGIMGVPLEVAQHARLGLGLMILWAPSIAWRRYRQGLLIRFHHTRMVGFGTLVRVSSVTLINLTLYLYSNLSGVQIVGIALVSSVCAEALFAQFSSRSVVRKYLSSDVAVVDDVKVEEAPGGAMELADVMSPVGNLEPIEENQDDRDPPLTFRKLLSFHSPLVLTTMVTLIGSPLVSTFLSKSPDPVLSLAAWQVAFSVLWLFRTITFALPEVVITLYKDDQSARKLRDFCVWIGFATSAIALFVAGSRLDIWVFTYILKASPVTANTAHLAFFAAAPLGFINAMQSYVRGMLTAHHLNVSRFAAVIVGIVALIAGLWIGLHTPWSGVLASAIAFNFALICELSVLVYFWRTARRPVASTV